MGRRGWSPMELKGSAGSSQGVTLLPSRGDAGRFAAMMAAADWKRVLRSREMWEGMLMG